ncbi:Zinc metalloproteinase nas-13 [Armadillidium nasatum]|uniref:Zinc metalloproteinase nas-13 n=1 Tax=Armadillidium nasatum TaxID=96803 RepID=A0A5N5SUQ2_9CRUS|nr:Zinc metalloproteinase nas-13 [Armadillidium nasatum]
MTDTTIRVGRRSFTCFCFLLGGICVISVAYVPSALLGLNLTLGLIGVACMSVAFCLVYILSAELVPTSVRNISVGTSSMFARIGSAIAPYIVDLLLHLSYFGILAIIAGLLCLLLPETRNKKLPESIQEIELMSR